MAQTLFLHIDHQEIPFHVGESMMDMHGVLNQAKPHDWWFQVKDEPSRFVLASTPENMSQDTIHKLIYHGVLLSGGSPQNKNKVRFNKVCMFK